MRTVKLTEELGKAFTAARQVRGIDHNEPLKQEMLEEIEKKLNTRIPDPIIGYYGARLAGWDSSSPPADPRYMVQLTMGLREDMQEHIESGRSPDWVPTQWVIFEEDDGNLLGFRVGSPRDTTSIAMFDHEGNYLAPPIAMDLSDRVMPYLEEVGEDIDLLPFEPLVERERRLRHSEPEEIPDTVVSHPKFGRGKVVEMDQKNRLEKWTVAFDDGETRKLLRRFLTVEG